MILNRFILTFLSARECCLNYGRFFYNHLYRSNLFLETYLDSEPKIKTPAVSKPVRDATVVDSKPKSLGWCNLERNLGSDLFIHEKLVSTSKNIIFVDRYKGFYDTLFFCKSICGRMFKPDSQNENDEVHSIMKRNGAWDFFIRLTFSIEESFGMDSAGFFNKEGIWRDPETEEIANFTNWGNGEYMNSESYALFHKSDGKWYETSDTSSMVVCELP